MGFWLQLGVAGFRMDAAPFIIELTEPGNPNRPKDFEYLDRTAPALSWRRGDAVMLAEANVERDELVEYFGDRAVRQPDPDAVQLHAQRRTVAGPGPRRGRSRSSTRCADTPALPPGGQWATFLRNHDEIDLGRLTAEQRDEVFAAVRSGAGHAALRPGHPPPAGADARQRPAAHRAGVHAAVHPAGHARCCATARRSAWATTCRCRSATPSARPMQWSDAAERRLLDGDAEPWPPGDHRRGVRLREGQRRPRSGTTRLAAELVRADDPHAARVPGGRRRRVRRPSTRRCRRRARAPCRGAERARCCSCTTSARGGTGGSAAAGPPRPSNPNQVFADQDYPDWASVTPSNSQDKAASA